MLPAVPTFAWNDWVKTTNRYAAFNLQPLIIYQLHGMSNVGHKTCDEFEPENLN